MAEKMYIPTLVADSEFKPAVVQPRVFFYNGKKELNKPFRFAYQSGPTTYFVASETNFPYFDHYATSSVSQDPNLDSDSLLFFNEGSVYGFTPQQNLYSKYWSKYVGLLYNPTTRFVECEAVIPFSQYVGMKLNDIVIYRGNHFHLRAINDYNLQSGECKLQLLGPILDDALDGYQPDAPITPIQPGQPSTTTTSTTSTSTTSTSTTSTTTSAPCNTGLTSIAIGYSAGSTEIACEKTDVRIVYKNGLWLDPSTVVYSSADGCDILPGFYAPLDGEEGAGNVFQINQFGDVVGSAACPSGGTTTTTEAPTVYTVGYRTSGGAPISSFACGTSNVTLYASVPTFGQVGVGARIYSDASGTPLQGGDTWFGISENSGQSTGTILISNTGFVTDDDPASCTTTTTSTTSTTTTTTQPPMTGYLVTYNESNEATACSDTNEFTVYSPSNPITLPGQGLSYLYNTPNVNDPVAIGYYRDVTNDNVYYVEGGGLVQEILTCPNTTTTTQPPCYPISVVKNRNAELACCDGISTVHYFNASTIENATISYGTDATCTNYNPFNDHYKVGNQYYVSTNGVMSGPFDCPDCP